MRAVLVFFIILAAALPTGECVASGGTREAGQDATKLVSGDRAVSVPSPTGAPGSDSSRFIREAAKRDEFLPILVNTPGIHGFAPQKSQEPDATIVTVSRTYARPPLLRQNGLNGSPEAEKGSSHP